MQNSSPNSPQLVAHFGLGMAIIFVISNIIGSGVFKKVAVMSQTLQDPKWVLFAWLLAGLITLLGVLSTVEAASMFPHSGGPFSWLREMYGSLFGYLYGWSCFSVIQSASIASIAYVFAGALGSMIALPQFSQETVQSFHFLGIYPLDNIGAKLVSIGLIFFLTAINMRGAKMGGKVSQIFTISVVIGILLIIVTCFFAGGGSFQHILMQGSEFDSKGLNNFSTLMGGILIAMQGAFWAYQGWISLGYIGEEIQDAPRNLPKALILGVLAVMAIYLTVNFAYLYAMPVDSLLKEITANKNSIAAVVVMKLLVGDAGGSIVAILILISTFGCTNSTILAASRIYYAMAKQGEFPQKLGETHPTYKTPNHSLMVQAIWSSVLVLSGSFDTLTDLF